jgi:hypothetical protein
MKESTQSFEAYFKMDFALIKFSCLMYQLDVVSVLEQIQGSDMYRLNNFEVKTLPCGKLLFNRRHLLLWFPKNTWKKRFDIILLSRLGMVLINFNISPSLHTVSYAVDRSTNTSLVFSWRWKWKPASMFSTTTMFPKPSLMNRICSFNKYVQIMEIVAKYILDG